MVDLHYFYQTGFPINKSGLYDILWFDINIDSIDLLEIIPTSSNEAAEFFTISLSGPICRP